MSAMETKTISVRRTNQVYQNMQNPYILNSYYNFKTLEKLNGTEISGSSPPDIFIGRYGYPNVYIGPLVPPQFGDTSIMAEPERWVGLSIPQIVELRSTLIRGMYRTKVTKADNGRIEEMIKELALAEKYGGVEEKLLHRPHPGMRFDENSQPYGPSARMLDMSLGNIKANPQIEKAYYDTSMAAKDAIIELYEKGVAVSKIQKTLSAGILGRQKSRKFVPTRWSITAVDDTLSKNLLKVIKQYEPVDSIKAFYSEALDNRWLVLILPGSWEYELVEAWYPNTTWNLESREIAIYSSYEPFEGRTKYAEIGGCYYAARLASAELLESFKGQAKVVILREAHPGYIMPVGVWNVREHVRATLKSKPIEFNDLYQAVNFVSSKMDIPIASWVRNSTLLRKALYQRRLA
ncbi:MAG: Nre family DNA repair protein [Candidatus Micrarchaeaceae archaeon]